MAVSFVILLLISYLLLHQFLVNHGLYGFGMRKEDWSRKPKEAFKKTKDRYGDRRGHVALPSQGLEAVSTNFNELARLRQVHERRFNRGATISKLVFGLGVLVMAALLFYAIVTGLRHS